MSGFSCKRQHIFSKNNISSKVRIGRIVGALAISLGLSACSQMSMSQGGSAGGASSDRGQMTQATPKEKGSSSTDVNAVPAAGYPTHANVPAGLSGAGPFQCPTVTSEKVRFASVGGANALSSSFTSTGCAGCHNGDGSGTKGIPSISNFASFEEFQAIVRAGRGAMPSVAASIYSDKALLDDYQKLKLGGLASSDEASSTLTLAEGLKLWRTVGKKKAACASCHAPDGIDLAMIGFTQADIIRRGAEHLELQQAVKISEYIALVRKEYKIETPCSTDWHVFQPAGKPLSESTSRKDQDLAFAKYLHEDSGLLIASKKLTSLAEIKAARDEVIDIDLRKLPLGAHLPRWTEDGFRGDAHLSFNDWIPDVPLVGTEAFYGIQDAYLKIPSQENFAAMLKAVETQTSDLGVKDQLSSLGVESFAWFSRNKYLSVLSAQHLFRQELTLGKSVRPDNRVWFSPVADEFKYQIYNPFMGVASSTRFFYCSVGDCLPTSLTVLPEDVKKKHRQEFQTIRDLFETVSHPWNFVGQLFDQSLVRSEGAGHNGTEQFYWTRFKSQDHDQHRLFLNFHRTMMQTQAPAPNGGQGWAMFYRFGGKKPSLSPLLQASWVSEPESYLAGIRADAPGAYLLLNYNIVFTMLSLARDELSRDSRVDPYMMYENNPTISNRYDFRNAIKSWKEQLQKLEAKGMPVDSLVSQADLDKLTELNTQVLAALAAATVVRLDEGPN